jgi:5'-3' exonuclease
MGVPKYFSFIIRNYPTILKDLDFFNKKDNKIHTLFFDANSIIYDTYHRLNYDDYKNDEDFENTIIDNVISYIEKTVRLINPSHHVFVTFDGMAPLAKMNQQRKRRTKQIFFDYYNDTNKWSTINITPFTPFMNKLSARVYKHFGKIENVSCSCSDEPGEGEQKITEYIRNHEYEGKNIAIYGLDSDLIMLSLCHLEYCKNIYVFREVPEFLNSHVPVNKKTDDGLCFIDINCMATRIPIEMGWKPQHRMVYEYVVMCFLLGNDFMERPFSINIYTNGFDRIFNSYKCALKDDEYIINEDLTFNNKNMNKILHHLSLDEDKVIEEEWKLLKTYRDRTRNRKTGNEIDDNYRCLLEVKERGIGGAKSAKLSSVKKICGGSDGVGSDEEMKGVGVVGGVCGGVVGLWLYYRLGLGIGLELWSGCEGSYVKSVCGIVGERGCEGCEGCEGGDVKSVCDTGLVGGNGKKDVVRDIIGNVFKDVKYQVELGARYL